MALDPINAALALSDELLSSLDAYVRAQILSTFLDEIPGVDVIGRSIDNELTKSEVQIQAAESEIKTQIEPLLSNAIPDAIAIVTSLAKSLDDHLTQLLNNIASVDDVLTPVIGTIRKEAPALASWIYNEVSGGLGQTFLNVLKTMEGQEPEGINALLDELLKLPNPPSHFKVMAESLRNRGAEWQALALPALLVGALIGIAEALQEPFQTYVRQLSFNAQPTREADTSALVEAATRELIDEPRYLKGMAQNGFNTDIAGWMLQSRQTILDPTTAALAMFRGNLSRTAFETELAHSGINPERANSIAIAAQKLMVEDDLRSAFLRGIITAQQHDETLQGYGYTEATAQLMRQLYFFIPPVSDLIHFGIRNVFSPDLVARFNLIGDYPQAFEDAAKQQGISQEWAQKYWESHWVVPGRAEIFAMYQRTIDKPLDDHADRITLLDGTEVYNIIGIDTVNYALKDVDTPPFWRDKVTQVAYRPITRVDIRRLHKVGLLSKAQVQRAYLDLGYSPAHALLEADFTEILNSTTSKTQTQTMVTGIQKEVIRLYVADKLSLDQVESTLTDLGFTKPEIDVFVAEANLIHQSQQITAIENGVGRLYSAGLITDQDAITRLQNAGVPVDAQTALFDKWDLEIEYRGGSDHIIKHRDLTKSEVVTALIDNLIDQSTAESMLEALGYDKNGADAEISLALYKAAVATKRTQIDAIKASYVNGVIQQLDASNRLDALSIPTDQRDAYIAEWQLAQETRTERIPIATLRDMFKGNYLSETDLLPHLKRHRFTDADAALLIQFWKGQPAPKGLVSNVSSA